MLTAWGVQFRGQRDDGLACGRSRGTPHGYPIGVGGAILPPPTGAKTERMGRPRHDSDLGRNAIARPLTLCEMTYMTIRSHAEIPFGKSPCMENLLRIEELTCEDSERGLMPSCLSLV